MLSLIVAMDKNNLIGKDNELPWHYKEDLQYFKEVTSGKKVIMGKNTFLSIFEYIKKPLPNRDNYVVTRTQLPHEGINLVNNLDEIINTYADTTNDEEMFIIGGLKMYEIGLEKANRMYITHIDKEHDGNVYFPNIDFSKWKVVEERKVGILSFVTYERK